MMESVSSAHRCYCFGPFRLDIARQLLYKDEQPVDLPRRLVRALQLFVENAGKDLEKDYMMEQLWAGRIVEENSLSAIISRLRKVLGDDAEHKKYILTNPGRGYRFVADVSETAADTPERLETLQSEASLVSAQTAQQGGRTFPADGVLSRWLGAVVGILVLLALCLAIHAWSPHATTQSIAVLPFQAPGAERGDVYLELGMADGLIARLRNMRHVLVRPTADVAKYQGATQDPLSVGRVLHVTSLLNGTVQRTGDQISVKVNLLRVNDGAIVWSHEYHGRLVDILGLQDQIAQETRRVLALNLDRAQQQSIRPHYTGSNDAYQAYIAGRYYCHSRSVEKGAGYLQQAIEKDPLFALAYAGLAGCYLRLAGPPWGDFASRGSLSVAQYLMAAETAARRALEIDGTLADAYLLLAQLRAYYDWDFAAAESAFRKSISLAPDDPPAHIAFAEFLIAQSRFEQAEREVEIALRLDPFSWDANLALAETDFFAGRYAKAAQEWEKVRQISLGDAPWYLAWIYSLQRQPFPMIPDLVKADQTANDNAVFAAALAYAYALQGMRAEAENCLRKLARHPDQLDDYQVSLIYVALGDRDRAFELLGRARDRRSPNLLYLKLDPRLQSLRSDPRFKDLAHSLHLSP